MARRLNTRMLLAAVFFALTLFRIDGAAAAERRLMVFDRADFAGFDYRTVKDVDLDACKAACLGEDSCQAFTFNHEAAWCFLKSDFGTLTTTEGATAGRVAAGAPSPEAAPALDLSYLPQGIDDEAGRLRRAISAIRPSSSVGFSAIVRDASVSMADGDARKAAEGYRSALALDDENAAIWLDLSRTVLAIEPEDYTERYDLPEEASAAAYIAVGLVASDRERAGALAVLAETMERREFWRPAIETYKASLAIAEAASVRESYDRVRAEYGFRMIDYTVDAESATPRVCVQFSEDLAGGDVEIADYVTLDGLRPAAVAREAQQVCIDGLKHGERYQVGLRQGLPSTVGEKLESPVDLSVYVRDRSAAVRFTGRNYVLPRTGAIGIPIVSINSRLIHAEIYRIGERGLASALRDEGFLDQLATYSVEDIADRRGERVWQGEMPVTLDLNREVVTAFPVDEVLPDPEPGIYILSAWADGVTLDDWEERPTQWFIVTDLGLASLMAEDGLYVFARSLSTAEPVAGLDISLIASGNDELGRAVTDETGLARFPAGLTRGEGGMAPAVVTAEGSGDYAFLDLDASPFDLTDRGVEGRTAPGAIDVFAYTERGVYRPGETVHLMALARDAAANAVNAPLTIVVERPDGVDYRRVTSNSGELGGHALDVDLDPDVLTGTWRARIYGDPEAPALTEAVFLVEDFVPERLDFTLDVAGEALSLTAPAEVTIAGKFLYGAPAAALGLEGEVIVRPATTAPAPFANYRFGLADEEIVPVRKTLEGLPATDEEGHATFDVRLPEAPQTTGRLEADIVVRMREGGGRAVERRTTLPVDPVGPMIGIRPLFEGDEVSEDALAGFEVIGVDAQMQRAALGAAHWELLELHRSYEWYRQDGSWYYEAVVSSTRVAGGELTLGVDDLARIDVPVDWGRYRLEVTASGNGAPASSVEFTAGWYAAEAEAETPDILDVSLDRPDYRPGDTATVRLSPRFAGKALVTVMAESVLDMRAVEVGTDGAVVDFTVGDDWGAGAYVTAMLYRPMNVDAGQNPARSVGIDWIQLNTEDREIAVDMVLPETADPRSTLAVPLTLEGLAPGEEARVAVAAVDVGILNLTGYTPPEPEGWYFGQRALGVEIRDLYGRLIDGLQGARGEVRSGGGEGGLSMAGAPPTEEPVALFSGIVSADENGKAEVVFDLPAFNGTLRLMAVAWTAGKVGHGSADVIVRDPVVVTASLPRFLAPGDRSRLWLDIDNVAGPAGNWTLGVAIDGPVTSALSAADAEFDLGAGERRSVAVPISAVAVGQSTVSVRLAHESGIEVARDLNLRVRPAQPAVTRRSIQTLAASSGRLTVTPDLVADLVPGSARVSLAVTRGLLLDVPGILDALDRYPYGCTEQVTSRALPLVYLNEVAQSVGIGADAEITARIDAAIASNLQRQGANGSFGLWGPGGDDLWLDAYVTDFLTRAREAGHAVPTAAFNQALDRLENGLAYFGEVTGDGEPVAYALYVLARNRRASIGDLRYYADAKLDELGSPLAQAQLGAALSLYGDGERATRAFRAAVAYLQTDDGEWDYRSDYGSQLRDSAATLALAAESRAADIALPAVARMVDRERDRKSYTTTQENAWLLLAANALAGEDETISLSVDGVAHAGRLLRRLGDEAVRSGQVTIANDGASDVEAVVTVTGVPSEPEPTSAEGLKIERRYYTLDGEEITTDTVAQNERLVVVINVTEERARRARLLVEDFLPAGFEIDNPRLVEGGDTGNLAWLGDTVYVDHSEFRDDRFAAALDRSGSDAEVLTLAYVVRAVTPGRYAHPPVAVEDMYQPEVHARSGLGTIEIVGPAPR